MGWGLAARRPPTPPRQSAHQGINERPPPTNFPILGNFQIEVFSFPAPSVMPTGQRHTGTSGLKQLQFSILCNMYLPFPPLALPTNTATGTRILWLPPSAWKKTHTFRDSTCNCNIFYPDQQFRPAKFCDGNFNLGNDNNQ